MPPCNQTSIKLKILTSISLIFSIFHTVTGATTIVQLPLAFVRSGYVDLTDGYIIQTGSVGYGWSRTSTNAHAHDLWHNDVTISPSSSTYRWSGFPPPLPYFLFPLSTTWVEAAEGETKPIITTARRVDSCSIEIQVVGINKGYGYTWPGVPVAASIPNITIIETYSVATDKSQW